MAKWFSVVALSVLIPATALAQKKSLTPVDYEEIRALYSRYVTMYDTGNAQMIGSVFTPDITVIIGGRLVGDSRDKIAATLKPRVGLSGTRHIPTNIAIEPSPEGATGTQYLLFMNFQDGKAPTTRGGIYHDLLVKTPEGWRFKKRDMSWFSTPPALPATTP